MFILFADIKKRNMTKLTSRVNTTLGTHKLAICTLANHKQALIRKQSITDRVCMVCPSGALLTWKYVIFRYL